MSLSKPLPGIQVNWAHPLTRGLIGCWLFNEGAGSQIADLSAKRSPGVVAGGSWKGSSVGRGFDVPDGTAQIDCDKDISLGSEDCTILYIGTVAQTEGTIFESDDNSGISLVSSRRADGDEAITLLASTKGSGSNLNAMFIFDTVGVALGCYGATTLTTGVIYHLVGTFEFTGAGDHGGNWNVFLNGKQDNASTNNYDLVGAASFPFTGQWSLLGHPQWAGGSDITGHTVYIWNRVLTDLEIAQLYADPYAMFQSPAFKPWMFVPSGVIANDYYYRMNQ